jgi:hypothetical protein
MKSGDKLIYISLFIILVASFSINAFFTIFSNRDTEDLNLEVISAGNLFERIEMNKIKDGSTLEYALDGGINLLSVERGFVRMISSDCPGGDCLKMRPINSERGAIVCVPHNLVIRLRPRLRKIQTDEPEIDAFTY